MGLGKVFTKKCAQLHVLFAVETILSLDRTWKSFDKNVWPVTHFFRSADYLKFLMGLGKVFTKKCAQLHVFSQWRLTWVFGWDLEKFQQKGVPSYTFFRCGDYLKFWIGLRKVSKKTCAQLHVFAVQTILSFWMGLRKIPTKMCAQLHVFSLWRQL